MRGLPLLLATLVTLGAHAPDDGARLAAAKRDAAAAAVRAAELRQQAVRQQSGAVRAQRELEALAARVAASAAALHAAEVRLAIADAALGRHRAALARAQAPVARLLAALQSLARRPAAVVIAQPGSVDDLVHVRAVLGASIPAVRARTAGIRAAIDQTRRLQDDAALATRTLRARRMGLEAGRRALAALEARYRADATVLARDAMAQSDRALALGERARDLVDRMTASGLAQATAGDLARLPAPPSRPLASGAVGAASPHGVYRLPVDGQLVTGFDELAEAGFRARGLTFSVSPGAPVIAPAGGRITYAGAFRGYDRIVIIDHGDGWTTLLTGLGALAVGRDAEVEAGTPLGHAPTADAPRITVELRRQGRPVDIAALVG